MCKSPGCGGGSGSHRSTAKKSSSRGAVIPSAIINGVGSRSPASGANALRMVSLDTEGMTLIRYVGPNLAGRYWQRQSGGLSYKFSGRAGPASNPFLYRDKWVKNEDVEFLLSQREGGQPAFQLIERGGAKETPVAETKSLEIEVAEPVVETAVEANGKRLNQSQADYAATRRARQLAAAYYIDWRQVAGTGADGRVLVGDVQNVIEQITADATPDAVKLADERGVDLRQLVYKLDRRITIADVRDHLKNLEAAQAQIDADVDAFLRGEFPDYEYVGGEGDGDEDEVTD